MKASVVIASHGRAEQIEACLAAATSQSIDDVEVIVVDSGPDGATAELVATRFPDVQLIRSVETLGPHEARNLGVAASDGAIIAFTDADCIPARDWIERLLAAHVGGARLVGGGIDPDSAGLIERGANLCKFGLWLAGLPDGERSTVPTANLSLTRELWDQIGPFTVGGWSGDTEFVWRARRAGVAAEFRGDATVAHRDPVTLGRFLRERRERGRAFARLRTREESWSRARAGAYLLLSPLIAIWLAVRGFTLAVRSGRPLSALTASPITGAGYLAWATGEASAYAAHLAGSLHER